MTKRTFTFLFLINLALIFFSYNLSLIEPMVGDPIGISNFLGDVGNKMFYSCCLFGGFCVLMLLITDTIPFFNRCLKKSKEADS